MGWYSHLFQNFPQFIVIHTVKGFGIVNKAEITIESSKLLNKQLHNEKKNKKHCSLKQSFYKILQDTGDALAIKITRTLLSPNGIV